ncbi:MAG: hypothetical protein ABSC23_08840 [Bryobacteraceae bacterium]
MTAYPRTILLYYQIVSGEVLRVCYRFLSSGEVDIHTVMVGLSLVPIPPLLLLTMLYLESAGKLGVNIRRIGSGVASGVMLLATGWSAADMFPSMFPQLGGTPASWRTPLGWAYWWVSMVFFLTWALLMGIFAVRRTPLCDRVTAWVVDLIGVSSAINVCAVLGSIALGTGFRLRHPVADAMQIAAPLLILIFAISVRQAASLARQNVR